MLQAARVQQLLPDSWLINAHAPLTSWLLLPQRLQACHGSIACTAPPRPAPHLALQLADVSLLLLHHCLQGGRQLRL